MTDSAGDSAASSKYGGTTAQAYRPVFAAMSC